VPEFVHGLDLAERFYRDLIAPRLAGVPHAAALLGWGSEVLGFDTPRSTDHAFGPRLQVFVAGDEVELTRAAIEMGLPDHYRGFPVRFGWDDTPVTHHVEVTTLERYLRGRLGFDPREGVGTTEWLSTPQQLLLGVTRGRVFHDPARALGDVRRALAWYPPDVWRYVLAVQWGRIEQEEAFVGRTSEVGDDLGSRVITARLVRDVMRLCFLLEREYAPYSKWLGSAFARLAAAPMVRPELARALAAGSHAEREAGLVAAYEIVARRHNALGLTAAVEPSARLFYGRPFRVIDGSRFVAACRDAIVEEELRNRPLTGAIDQWVDSTDVLSVAPIAQRAGRSLACSDG
jgi:hypothetical protein